MRKIFDDNNLIFIFSSPRSGSTLVRLTLNKLPGIIALPETHFWVFREKYSHLNFKNDLRQIAENWIDYHSIKKFPIDKGKLINKITSSAKEWKDLLEITAEEYMGSLYVDNKDFPSVLCEKSPPHIFYVDAIKKEYPSAKFVFLIRDPRDVVASLKYCGWSTSNPVVNSLVWKNGIKKISAYPNSFVLKYEELVEKPEETLGELCQFLGIKFDPFVLQEKTLDNVEINNPTSTNSLRPISRKFVGGYSDKLSRPDREQDIIEYLCESEMRKFGYLNSEKVKKDLSLRIRIFYFKLAILISRLTK